MKLYVEMLKFSKTIFFQRTKYCEGNIEKPFKILYFDMDSSKINKLFDKTCVNIFLSNL